MVEKISWKEQVELINKLYTKKVEEVKMNTRDLLEHYLKKNRKIWFEFSELSKKLKIPKSTLSIYLKQLYYEGKLKQRKVMKKKYVRWWV